jgi:hypothetical protein
MSQPHNGTAQVNVEDNQQPLFQVLASAQLPAGQVAAQPPGYIPAIHASFFNHQNTGTTQEEEKPVTGSSPSPAG